MYERFVRILQDNGITAAQLSQATGIPQSTFSDWKKGKSKPKLEKLQKIADYFGVSIDYLLGKTDIKNKPADYGKPSNEQMNNKPELQAINEILSQMSEAQINDALHYCQFLKEKEKNQ